MRLPSFERQTKTGTKPAGMLVVENDPVFKVVRSFPLFPFPLDAALPQLPDSEPPEIDTLVTKVLPPQETEPETDGPAGPVGPAGP